MDYLKNHCWCSSSNWNCEHYDCSIIVSLTSYKNSDVDDWNNIMIGKEYFDSKEYEQRVKYFTEECNVQLDDIKLDEIRGLCFSTFNTLKPEVFQWLEDNVTDSNKGEKMWCIGSDEYLQNDSVSSFSIFFQRRKDAMLFIKTWSKYKKPVNYPQYFSDVRKTLKLETLKYEMN